MELIIEHVTRRFKDKIAVDDVSLSDESEVEDSFPVEPRLEDLCLWLLPQEAVEREEK